MSLANFYVQWKFTGLGSRQALLRPLLLFDLKKNTVIIFDRVLS
jgi:hypothetical protein